MPCRNINSENQRQNYTLLHEIVFCFQIRTRAEVSTVSASSKKRVPYGHSSSCGVVSFLRFSFVWWVVFSSFKNSTLSRCDVNNLIIHKTSGLKFHARNRRNHFSPINLMPPTTQQNPQKMTLSASCVPSNEGKWDWIESSKYLSKYELSQVEEIPLDAAH